MKKPNPTPTHNNTAPTHHRAPIVHDRRRAAQLLASGLRAVVRVEAEHEHVVRVVVHARLERDARAEHVVRARGHVELRRSPASRAANWKMLSTSMKRIM